MSSLQPRSTMHHYRHFIKFGIAILLLTSEKLTVLKIKEAFQIFCDLNSFLPGNTYIQDYQSQNNSSLDLCHTFSPQRLNDLVEYVFILFPLLSSIMPNIKQIGIPSLKSCLLLFSFKNAIFKKVSTSKH